MTRSAHSAAGLLSAALLGLTLLSCGDASSPTDPSADTDAVGVSADVSDAFDAQTSYLSVVHTLYFAREEPSGVTEGFNLDGLDSTVRDRRGCNAADMTDPTGRTGIDNEFARLFPLIQALGGDIVEAIAQSAIDDGRLLLMVQVDGVDDLVNDASVDVTISRGTGSPLMATNGFLEPYQTFAHDETQPTSHLPDVPLIDGVVEAGPFNFDLYINVLGEDVDLRIIDAMVRLEMREDGTFDGVLGGGVPKEDVVMAADFAGGDLTQLVRDIIDDTADLAPDEDGECQRMSVGLMVDSIPAFFHGD